MGSIKNYFTRQAHNEGVRLYIAAPDGSETQDWVEIRGIESDIFRETRNQSEAELYASLNGITDTKERIAKIESVREDARLRLLVSLVKAWSFDEECNEENIIALLKEAPFIADFIDKKSASVKDFIKKN